MLYTCIRMYINACDIPCPDTIHLLLSTLASDTSHNKCNIYIRKRHVYLYFSLFLLVSKNNLVNARSGLICMVHLAIFGTGNKACFTMS